MQEKLVIYLHARDLEHPSWAVVGTDSVIKKSVANGDPAELTDEANERDIIVIVPAEDVLLASVMLPKMNRTRLLQAIPYALEDQLIADVETLHFAHGPHQPGLDLPVAIIARDKMTQWLALLKSWHIDADVMLPLTLALPWEQNTWHVLIDEVVAVRSGVTDGFASDRINFPSLLDLAITSHGYVPQHIRIDNVTSHAFATALRVTAKVDEDFMAAPQVIEMLASQCRHAPVLNLLQAAFAVKKSKMPQMSKVLKLSAYLGISWIAIILLYPIIAYMIINRKVSDIDMQIAQIYKQNFPQASTVVEPKIRMQEKLEKLTAQIGENRVLLLMGYVGKAMSQVSTVKLKRVEFQSSQLTVELTAATSEDFSAFTDNLAQQGLNVKQQNANLVGDKINATVVIE